MLNGPNLRALIVDCAHYCYIASEVLVMARRKPKFPVRDEERTEIKFLRASYLKDLETMTPIVAKRCDMVSAGPLITHGTFPLSKITLACVHWARAALAFVEAADLPRAVQYANEKGDWQVEHVLLIGGLLQFGDDHFTAIECLKTIPEALLHLSQKRECLPSNSRPDPLSIRIENFTPGAEAADKHRDKLKGLLLQDRSRNKTYDKLLLDGRYALLLWQAYPTSSVRLDVACALESASRTLTEPTNVAAASPALPTCAVATVIRDIQENWSRKQKAGCILM